MDSFLNNSFLNNFNGYLKEHSGSIIASACSLLLAAVIAFGNTQRNGGANDIKQQDIERRVVLLESDRATRAEVKAVNDRLSDFQGDTKPRLQRIEDLLLKDIRFHEKSGR